MQTPEIDARILEFIADHHVLTLATSHNGFPYCANCFYTYLADAQCFVFATDMHTKHAQDALANPRVAASIVLETSVVGKIQGLQITGTMTLASQGLGSKATMAYLKAFPFAILKQTELWELRIDFCKFTDNRLGFGKKIIWGKLPE